MKESSRQHLHSLVAACAAIQPPAGPALADFSLILLSRRGCLLSSPQRPYTLNVSPNWLEMMTAPAKKAAARSSTCNGRVEVVVEQA